MRRREHPTVGYCSSATEVLRHATSNRMHPYGCLAWPVGDPGLFAAHNLGSPDSALLGVHGRKWQHDCKQNGDRPRTHGFPSTADLQYPNPEVQHTTVTMLSARCWRAVWKEKAVPVTLVDGFIEGTCGWPPSLCFCWLSYSNCSVKISGIHGVSVLQTRNPTLLLRKSKLPLSRLAERRSTAVKNQEPPRRTRMPILQFSVQPLPSAGAPS